MTDRRPRLTTRGIRTAEHIRDMKPFTTSGSLSAQATSGLGPGTVWNSRLDRDGDDYAAFIEQCNDIRYVVFSYATPIAWWSTTHGWHKVSQRFSPTTGKHQGNLYLITHGDVG